MPLAKGGLRYLQRKKPSGTRIQKITPLGQLGRGGEGHVHKVTVVVQRGDKTKTRTLVQKTFLRAEPGNYGMPRRNFRLPVAQFNTLMRLRKLNQVKKLGLRIVPTIRLVKTKNGKPTLLMSLLKEVPEANMHPVLANQYEIDKKRQIQTLKREGYVCNEDAFMPVIDPNTGKCIAVIFDFGNIQRGKINVR